LSKIDYSKIIDPETWEFIIETEKFFSSISNISDIEEKRHLYTEMCKSYSQEWITNVSYKDLRVKKTNVRQYSSPSKRKDGPVIIFLHGGGFTYGNIESHDNICVEFCSATSLDVFSLNTV